MLVRSDAMDTAWRVPDGGGFGVRGDSGQVRSPDAVPGRTAVSSA